jgi:hypothetical protein
MGEDIMSQETTVSGAIKYTPSTQGGIYMIRGTNGQGWGLPVENISPTDLRVMADHLELLKSDSKV